MYHHTGAHQELQQADTIRHVCSNCDASTLVFATSASMVTEEQVGDAARWSPEPATNLGLFQAMRSTTNVSDRCVHSSAALQTTLVHVGIPRRHASIFDDAHLGADGEGLDCHESQMPRHLPACICTGSGRVERSRRVLQPSNRERKRVQRGRQCRGKTGGNRWSECVISVACHARQAAAVSSAAANARFWRGRARTVAACERRITTRCIHAYPQAGQLVATHFVVCADPPRYGPFSPVGRTACS